MQCLFFIFTNFLGLLLITPVATVSTRSESPATDDWPDQGQRRHGQTPPVRYGTLPPERCKTGVVVEAAQNPVTSREAARPANPAPATGPRKKSIDARSCAACATEPLAREASAKENQEDRRETFDADGPDSALRLPAGGPEHGSNPSGRSRHSIFIDTSIWCGRRGSNPHGQGRGILSPLRLPVPPRPPRRPFRAAAGARQAARPRGASRLPARRAVAA